MDILELMKADHEKALRLIEQLKENAGEEGQETRAMVHEIAKEVLLHAKSEEGALYKAIEEYSEKLKDFTLEGFYQHLLVEETLKRMIRTPGGEDGKLKALTAVLYDLVEHHGQEEEEEEIFPVLKEQLSDDELTQMGQNMQDLKERLEETVLKMIERQARRFEGQTRPSSDVDADQLSASY